MPDRIDQSIEITRRRFLAGSAMAGFAAFLAACGTQGQGSQAPSTGPETPGPTTTVAATEGPTATGGGTLNFANWIGYIDVSDDNKTHPTLDKFTKETTTRHSSPATCRARSAPICRPAGTSSW